MSFWINTEIHVPASMEHTTQNGMRFPLQTLVVFLGPVLIYAPHLTGLLINISAHYQACLPEYMAGRKSRDQKDSSSPVVTG